MGLSTDKKDIAIILFKVMSIYALIQAIDKLPSILDFMSRYELDEIRIVNLVTISFPSLLLALCGALLWYTAPFLATSIFRSMIDEDKSEVSSANIKEIAVSVFGLFILASSLPDISQTAIIQFTIVTFDSEAKTLRNTYFIISLFKIVLGLWLLFGSNRIVNFLRSTQTNGEN